MQPRRVNNLGALMIERGQFSAVYLIIFWKKICDSTRKRAYVAQKKEKELLISSYRRHL